MDCARTLRNLSREEVASPVLFDTTADQLLLPEMSSPPDKRTSMHSGKWSQEENNYAACIVAHFRSGSMRIPDGSTLRAVLSDRLDCVSTFSFRFVFYSSKSWVWYRLKLLF